MKSISKDIHVFVHMDVLDLELVEEVGSLDPTCSNEESITHFLALPTIIDTSNPKKCNMDPIVDFSKSLMLTSKAYMSIVHQIQD